MREFLRIPVVLKKIITASAADLHDMSIRQTDSLNPINVVEMTVTSIADSAACGVNKDTVLSQSNGHIC